MVQASLSGIAGTPRHPAAFVGIATPGADGVASTSASAVPAQRHSAMVQPPMQSGPPRRSGSFPPSVQAGQSTAVNMANPVLTAVHQPQLPTSPANLPRAASFSQSLTGSVGVQRLSSSPNLSSGTRTPGPTPTFAARHVASASMSPPGMLHPAAVGSPRLVSPNAAGRAVPGGVLPAPAVANTGLCQSASRGGTPLVRQSSRSVSSERQTAFISQSDNIPNQMTPITSLPGPRRTSALMQAPGTEGPSRCPVLPQNVSCLTQRAALPPGASLVTGASLSRRSSVNSGAAVLGCPVIAESLRPSSLGTSNRSSMASLHGSTASLQPEGPRILTQIGVRRSQSLVVDSKWQAGRLPMEPSRFLSGVPHADVAQVLVRRSSSVGAESAVAVVPGAENAPVSVPLDAPVAAAAPPVGSSLGATSSTMSLTGYLMGSSSAGDGTPRVRIDFGEEPCDVAVLPFCALHSRETTPASSNSATLPVPTVSVPASVVCDKLMVPREREHVTETGSDTSQQQEAADESSEAVVQLEAEGCPENAKALPNLGHHYERVGKAPDVLERAEATSEVSVECQVEAFPSREPDILERAEVPSEVAAAFQVGAFQEDAEVWQSPETFPISNQSSALACTPKAQFSPRLAELEQATPMHLLESSGQQSLQEEDALPDSTEEATCEEPLSPGVTACSDSDVSRLQAAHGTPATSSPQTANRGPVTASAAAVAAALAVGSCHQPASENQSSRPPSPLCTKIRLYEFANLSSSIASAGISKTPVPSKEGHIATPTRARATRSGSGAALRRSPRIAAEPRANSRSAAPTDLRHEVPGSARARTCRNVAGGRCGSQKGATTKQPALTAEATAPCATVQRFQRVSPSEEPPTREEPLGSGSDAAGVIYLFDPESV